MRLAGIADDNSGLRLRMEGLSKKNLLVPNVGNGEMGNGFS